MGFIQTKPLSPGSECQKHVARGRNRAQTCTTDAASHYRNRPTGSLWLPALTSHPFASHHITNLESRKENTKRKCGCGGGNDEDDDDYSTREQETRPGRTAALGSRTTSRTTTPDIQKTYYRLAPTTNTTTTDMLRSPPPPSAHRALSTGPLLQVCPGWSRCVAVVRLLYIPNGSNPEKSRSTLH